MAASSAAYYAIAKHSPTAYFPLQDKGATGREYMDRVTALGVSGAPTWGRRAVGRRPGGPSVELFTPAYLTGGTGAPFSPHAGASGLMSIVVVVMPGAGGSSLANSTMIVTKGLGAKYEYDIQHSSTGVITATFYTLAGGNVATVSSAAGALQLLRPTVIGVSFDRAAAQLVLSCQGVEVGRSTSFSSNTAASNATFQVGHRADNGGAVFQGGVSHLAIFDKYLPTGAHNQIARAIL